MWNESLVELGSYVIQYHLVQVSNTGCSELPLEVPYK